MRDQHRTGLCEDPDCPRKGLPTTLKGQNPESGEDECYACYVRRRRRKQGYAAPDSVRLNKQVAKSRNRIEEALLDLGFSPAEAAETISEIADRCPALYRFSHGFGPSDDVEIDMKRAPNMNAAPEQESEVVDVDTEPDVNVNAAVGDKDSDARTSPDVDQNAGVNVNGPALTEEGVAAIREAIESEPEVDVHIVQDVNVNDVEDFALALTATERDSQNKGKTQFPQPTTQLDAAIKEPEAPGLLAVEPAQEPESQGHERSLPMHEKKYFTNLLAKTGQKAQRQPSPGESAHDVGMENLTAAEKISEETRRAAILEVLQKGKSLGATQVMKEIEKKPGWEEWGSHDEYYDSMKRGIGSAWFKRGSLYNIALSPKKGDKITVDPEAIAKGDFSSILGH